MSQLYKILEFDRILSKLSVYAQSELAKKQCLDLKPYANLTKTTIQLELLQQFIDYQNAYEQLSFKGLYAHEEMFLKAKKEVYFSMYEIARTIENITIAQVAFQKINSQLKLAKFKHDQMLELVKKISPLFELRKYLSAFFNEYEAIKDDATPCLLQHTNTIKQIQKQIKDTLNGYLSSHADKLSQQTIVMRNDRYVLPVKLANKNSVKGIIHDQSVSGQTVFIEPREVVQLHLALQNEQFLKQEEITKILKMLTKEIMVHHQELSQNEYVLCQLDFFFAKASFANAYHANICQFSDERNFNLKDVWHPLLDAKLAIKNPFTLDHEKQVLLVSGSNTGGKTVLLKTIGIAVLMAKCGLAICAKEAGEIPYYEEIFADIGDEQSITNALSTFSSHITNIKYICDHANEKTLILLDEIGAGTDPQEGSALAISIIEYLASQKATALISTHFSKVKVFGFEKPYIKNASVVFDEIELRPTYIWSYNEPGKSHALLIAQKLGINSRIINHATQLLNESSQDVYAQMLALEKQIAHAKRMENEFEVKKNELELVVMDLEKQKKQMQHEKQNIIEQAKVQANTLVEETKISLKVLFNENKTLIKQHEINDAFKTIKELEYQKEIEENEEMLVFSLGEEVLIKSMNRTARIVQTGKNKYVVESDGKRINVKSDQLAKITNQPIKPKKRQYQHKTTLTKELTNQLEINLIGLRRDEALIQLDQFLNQALLNNLSSCRVVHGDGQGILRKAVHEYLKKSRFVKSYELASYYEGGTGATIVNF